MRFRPVCGSFDRRLRLLPSSSAGLLLIVSSATASERIDERMRRCRLIELHPTYGYRRLWALLRFGEGLGVNRKAVYRVLQVKRWFVTQRVRTPRPRVQGRRSRAERSNEHWAMDVTHIDCGRDGCASRGGDRLS